MSWWHQGAAIACDHEGCKASSDDYPDIRGFALYEFVKAERALAEKGWVIIGDDASMGLNTNKHYCPAHAPS